MTHFSKKRLEKLMNEQGITYAELSKLMGYSTNIESHLNDPISTDMLNKVSKILNTTKNYLIFEDDAPDNAALLREIILQINKLSICNIKMLSEYCIHEAARREILNDINSEE